MRKYAWGEEPSVSVGLLAPCTSCPSLQLSTMAILEHVTDPVKMASSSHQARECTGLERAGVIP